MYRTSAEEQKKIYEYLKGLETLNLEYLSLRQSSTFREGQRRETLKKLSIKARCKVALLNLQEKITGKTDSLNKMLERALNSLEYKEEDYFCDSRIAVYTAIFGAYDSFKEPLVYPDNVDYYIITDQEIAPKGFSVITPDFIPEECNTPTLKARYCKMHPHEIFKEYDYSLWIDGNVRIVSDITPMITTLEEYPISMHMHKNRDCVYDEIDACIEKGKVGVEGLEEQRKMLQESGCPKDYGLLETTMIMRKHTDERCINVMNAWWEELSNHTTRDQVSLIKVCWDKEIKPSTMGAMGNNTMFNARFQLWSHS